MKLLFVHDVKARLFGDKVFARSFGYDIWKERYLPSFDVITVLTRNMKSEVDLSGKLDLLSGKNVYYDARIGSFKGPGSFFSKRIRRIIRDDISASDFVICRLDSFLGLIAIRECKRLKKPFLVEVVGCVWDSFWNHGLFGKILAPFLFFQTRSAIKNSKYVIYVTKSFLQKRYPTKGLHINVSNVKIDSLNANCVNERIAKYSNIKGRKIILGTAANVDVKYKGQQFVIKALSLLKKDGFSNFEYQLPGSGDNSYLRRIAKKYNVLDKIVFKGSMTHETIMKWYKDIDVYIQPSLQEGLPRSVIEAMSTGCFCIGSNVAGIPELIDSNFVLNKHSICRDLCSILKRIDSKTMQEQALINYNNSKDYYNETLIERRLSFFEKIIENEKKRI